MFCSEPNASFCLCLWTVTLIMVFPDRAYNGLFSHVFRRKKKCIRYIQGEGSCVSPPSSDGSLLDSPPSSPTMLDSPTRDSNSQSEQTQPLSLSLKPEPLARLCMPHSPLTESPVRKPSNLPAIICQNGTDHSHQPSSLPPSTPYSLSTAQPSTSFLPTHRSLAGTQLQPLSLVTKSLE